MTTRRLLRIAGQSILKNKMRTLLTMLGIIIGVGAVIVMVAIGSGAKAQIRDQVQSLGTNMIVITPGAARQGAVSQGAQTFTRLTVADAEALAKQGSFAAVSPVIVTRTQVVGGVGNWRTTVTGVDAGYATIRDWQTTDGAFFEPADVAGMQKVVLLGATVAATLFPDGGAVGQQLRVGDIPMQVVGVLTPKGQTAEGTDQDDVVLIPYTTVMARLSRRSFLPQILASTYAPEDVAAGQQEAAAILRDTHRLSTGDPDDFQVRNQSDIASAASGTADVMTWLLSAIASISLLVGGIGIMNIMLVSVTERTREIGLRLALGARGGDVLNQFLVEALVMGAAGGLLGIGLGLGASTIVHAITGWSTHISLVTALGALAFAGSVGVFFGFYPARRAAGLDPIEALRYE